MNSKTLQGQITYEQIVINKNLKYFKSSSLQNQKTFAAELQTSLNSTPKYISPKFFYDENGSNLFDEICSLPEYYPYDSEIEILRIEGLSKTFTKKGFFHSGTNSVLAVNNVSFSLIEGEVLALVGQSGSGKSTIAKLILRSIEPDSGKIFFKQKEISNDFEHLKKFRSKCQMIHQDPYLSLIHI